MSTMRALTVKAWGEAPVLTSVPAPPQPDDDSQIQLKVVASGLPNLVRSQASGKHYSTTNVQLPYIPGADGVGVTSSGEYLFFAVTNTGGAFAEYINVAKKATFPVPFPKTDISKDEKNKIAIRVAALVNPTMASWLALNTRVHKLPPNYTVLINGVTSLSGQIAISNARAMGASKVIGLGRSEESLKKLGLDQYIIVQEPASKTDFAGQLKGRHVDVILDFVYGGGSTLELFKALPSNAALAHEMEVQYVQIGSLGGLDMEIPGALLRSKNLTIRGSGPGSWSVTKDMNDHFPGLLQRLVDGVGEFNTVERRLEDVEAAWSDTKSRSVFVL